MKKFKFTVFVVAFALWILNPIPESVHSFAPNILYVGTCTTDAAPEASCKPPGEVTTARFAWPGQALAAAVSGDHIWVDARHSQINAVNGTGVGVTVSCTSAGDTTSPGFCDTNGNIITNPGYISNGTNTPLSNIVQLVGTGGSPLSSLQVRGFNGRPAIAVVGGSSTTGPTIAGGKAYWDFQVRNLDVENIEFFGAGITSHSSTPSVAGIRAKDYANITFINLYVHDNLQGLFDPTEIRYGDVLIKGCHMERNGFPTGGQHNNYFGVQHSVSFINNFTTSSTNGQDLKTRAYFNAIIGNVFSFDFDGRYAGVSNLFTQNATGAGIKVPYGQADARGLTQKLIDIPAGGANFIVGNEIMMAPGFPLNSPPATWATAAGNNNGIYECSECATSDHGMIFGWHHPLTGWLTGADINSSTAAITVDNTYGWPTAPFNARLTSTTTLGSNPANAGRGVATSPILSDASDFPAAPFTIKIFSVVENVTVVSTNTLTATVAFRGTSASLNKGAIAELIPEQCEQITVTNYTSNCVNGSCSVTATRGVNGTTALAHHVQNFGNGNPGDRLEIGSLTTVSGTITQNGAGETAIQSGTHNFTNDEERG